ncbi:MAG: hypothetical protein ABIH23_32930 [bacterium]
MCPAHSISDHPAAAFVLMISVLSGALLGTLFLLLPQFGDVYLRTGVSVPFLTAAFIVHRDAAAVWFVGLGCLFTCLSMTRFFQRTPQTVYAGAIVLYATLMGTITLGLCMPLVGLVHRLG